MNDEIGAALGDVAKAVKRLKVARKSIDKVKVAVNENMFADAHVEEGVLAKEAVEEAGVADGKVVDGMGDVQGGMRGMGGTDVHGGMVQGGDILSNNVHDSQRQEMQIMLARLENRQNHARSCVRAFNAGNPTYYARAGFQPRPRLITPELASNLDPDKLTSRAGIQTNEIA